MTCCYSPVLPPSSRGIVMAPQACSERNASFARACGIMLRMSLRDPRVFESSPSRLRCDVGSLACKLQYPRDSQYTQLVLLLLNIVVLVGFLFCCCATSGSPPRRSPPRSPAFGASPRRLNHANVERTFWSPKWSPTGDHGAGSNGTKWHVRPHFPQINTCQDRTKRVETATDKFRVRCF
jgi:hypothetical protein